MRRRDLYIAGRPCLGAIALTHLLSRDGVFSAAAVGDEPASSSLIKPNPSPIESQASDLALHVGRAKPD